ncbi:MAG: IclR family transcriptional regulator [Eubacteriales bacterium]|nr:IclR family transcriptional regulator [Eubacteriales bacterium]
MDESNSINVILRTFKILETLFNSAEPMGISAIAAELKLPKVSTFRILSTLCECGAIEKDSDDRYRLGLMFVRYGERVRSDITIRSLAEPYLMKLRDITQETVNLSILYEGYVINIASFSGESFIITSRALPLSPLYCSSSGKIFLAHMDQGEIKDYFSVPRPKRTVRTITTYDEFISERQSILSLGISYDREEYEYGLYCIGAPVMGSDKKPVATISITGPSSRMELKGFDWLSKQVADNANMLSRTLLEAQL